MFEVPKSWPKYRKLKAEHGLIAPGKPDADNISKIILDALNDLAYKDDKQISTLKVHKCYCNSKHPKEGVFVGVAEVQA